MGVEIPNICGAPTAADRALDDQAAIAKSTRVRRTNAIAESVSSRVRMLGIERSTDVLVALSRTAGTDLDQDDREPIDQHPEDHSKSWRSQQVNGVLALDRL